MKKGIRFLGIIMALGTIFMMSYSASAQTADCSQSVDKICNGFKIGEETIRSYTTMEQLDQIDLAGAFDKAGVNDSMLESCGNYRLTDADKSKLKASYKGFMNVIADKTVQLMGIDMSLRPFIVQQMDPVIQEGDKIINKSTTLYDFFNEFSKMNN